MVLMQIGVDIGLTLMASLKYSRVYSLLYTDVDELIVASSNSSTSITCELFSLYNIFPEGPYGEFTPGSRGHT